MKRHLFLTGSGASAMLRAELDWRLAAAGGFVTVRLDAPDGSPLACELRPAAAAAGIEGYDSHRFLELGAQPPRKDNEVFRSVGVRLLQEAAFYPFCVFDQVGGFELVIPQFREALAELLSSELPIVGVLRPREDTEALRRSFGLGEKLSLLTARLYEALGEDGDTLLLDLSRMNEDAARRILRQWIAEYT